MGSLKPIMVVLSLMLAPLAVLDGEALAEDTGCGTVDPNPISVGLAPSPPDPLPLPSEIRLWEAWAKGYATVFQTDLGLYGGT